jgi:hypothetical protein
MSPSPSPGHLLARLRLARLRLDRLGACPGPRRHAVIGDVQADLGAVETGLIAWRDQRRIRPAGTTADRLDDYLRDLAVLRETGAALDREGADLAWSLRALDDLIADVAAACRRLAGEAWPAAARA